MSRAEIGDMGTILPSSNSKDSFLPCQKYCPLFNFLKEINYIKSFLFVLIFTLSMAICTYSGYLLFHLLKNFQLIKIFYLIIHSLLQGWNPPPPFLREPTSTLYLLLTLYFLWLDIAFNVLHI